MYKCLEIVLQSFNIESLDQIQITKQQQQQQQQQQTMDFEKNYRINYLSKGHLNKNHFHYCVIR